MVILGVVVSWVGTWLWNLASGRLSPALAGLLVNVETVAGFAYVYAAKLQWPPLGQLTGFVLVIGGVALAVRRQQPEDVRRMDVESRFGEASGRRDRTERPTRRPGAGQLKAPRATGSVHCQLRTGLAGLSAATDKSPFPCSETGSDLGSGGRI